MKIYATASEKDLLQVFLQNNPDIKAEICEIPESMQKNPCLYGYTTPEYKRLEAAAKLIECFTEKTVAVENTYFDYGQNWRWTTLICKASEHSMDYQMLCPRDETNICYP